MVPTVMIRYERKPYTSLVDDYVRVTFDRKLRYQPKVELAFDADPRRSSPIDDPAAMRVAPARLSYCKYTRGVDAMLHRPLSRARIG